MFVYMILYVGFPLRSVHVLNRIQRRCLSMKLLFNMRAFKKKSKGFSDDVT